MLRVTGIGRDAEHAKAVVVYLSQPLSDDEMRAFHEECHGIVQRMNERAADVTSPLAQIAREMREGTARFVSESDPEKSDFAVGDLWFARSTLAALSTTREGGDHADA